mgnify:CR=1 FL=1
MALINCPECNAQISDAAAQCPHCGCPVGPKTNPTPSYQQAPTYQQAPKSVPSVCPETHMTKAILCTLFCCLPFGVVGIINASKVSSLYAAGNVELAQAASLEAKKWTKIGFICGIVFYVLYFVVYGVGLAALMAGM